MFLSRVIRIDHVQIAVRSGMLIQLLHLAGRILEIIIDVDDELPPRCGVPGHHRIVFTEISGQIDDRERHWRAGMNPLHDLPTIIRTSIVDHDHFDTTFYPQFGDIVHQTFNAAGAAIDRYYDGEGDHCEGRCAISRSDPP